MPWAAAGAVAGALITANGAKKAAGQQSDSADRAAELQYEAQQQVREDLAPWVESGTNANSLLSHYLGTGGSPAGSSSFGIPYGLSEDQLRQQLTSRYTRTVQDTTPRWEDQGRWMTFVGSDSGQESWFPNWVNVNEGATHDVVDEEALNAAIQLYNQEQVAANAAAAGGEGPYGSLLRAYRNGEEFDPGPAFSFTGDDLATEPGYQFGLEQGEKGINRGQAARGNFLSGAAMKELARYNEDYAGTKFNDAYGRALGTYNTNLGARERAWGTNLGAYNDNRNRIYNFLSGTSSAGQNAATQVGNNAQQVANNVSSLATGAANANAAGTVAGSNAIANGLNQAYNAYASTNNLNSAAGWNNLLASQGGGYSGYTGYAGGGNDPIANLNTSRGWTN